MKLRIYYENIGNVLWICGFIFSFIISSNTLASISSSETFRYILWLNFLYPRLKLSIINFYKSSSLYYLLNLVKNALNPIYKRIK